jgi:signal transduction histidine kinase
MQQLRSNSRAIVDQLNDTIWVLNKESLSLTAISDRTKLFMRNIGRSYPGISFDCEEQIETDHLLPASQAFHLYRLLQEAINNALKHSGGTAIMVRMVAQTHWMVSIADNGVGLSDKGGGTGGGHGMAGMQQRCNAAGWQLNWQAAPGGGTVVTINSTTNSVFALV